MFAGMNHASRNKLQGELLTNFTESPFESQNTATVAKDESPFNSLNVASIAALDHVVKIMTS